MTQIFLMSWKKIVVDYFNFTRKDRIAIITLLILILAVFFLPKAISNKRHSKVVAADSAWIASMKRLEQKETDGRQYADDNSSNYQYDRQVTHNSSRNKGELFYFDPNKLSTADWQRLGLRDKTIHTIQNYLSKGGHFRKPEDLQKVYGLFPDEYERIAPYIKIESVVAEKENGFTTNKMQSSETKTFTRYTIIDINSADTTAFIALPGIGSKLAARIVNFRDKLGGFYTINQVGETFGLPDSTFQKIKQYLKLENVTVKKININTATVDELKAHPYIKWNIANPIVAYRNEHGPFLKIEDIKKVMVVTDEVYNKIFPYLVTQ